MSFRRPSLLVCLALLFASQAHGYTLKQTESGRPIRWASMPVSYRVSSAGARDLVRSRAVRAVQAAFSAWSKVPGTRIQLVYHGTSKGTVGVARSGANENLVAFSREAWPFEPDALAMTITAYKETSGELVDADILVNEEEYTWGESPEAENDLQNALTHEVGHFLGLGHSDVPEATMFARAEPWETEKRSLHADDMAAAARLYPAPPIAATAATTNASTAEAPSQSPTVGGRAAAQRTPPPIRIKTGCDQSGQSAAGGLWPFALALLLRRRRRA